MDGGQQDAGNIYSGGHLVTHLSSTKYLYFCFMMFLVPTAADKTSKWSSKETLLMAEMFGNISLTRNNGTVCGWGWETIPGMTGVDSTEMPHIHKHLQMTTDQSVSQSVRHPVLSPLARFSKLQSKLNNSRIVTRTVRRTITIFLFCLSLVLNSRFLTKTITSIESSQIPADIFTENSVYILWEKNSIL